LTVMDSETEMESVEIVSILSANDRPCLKILPRKSFSWFLNEVQACILCCNHALPFTVMSLILTFLQNCINHVGSSDAEYDQQLAILKRWNAMSEGDKLVCNYCINIDEVCLFLLIFILCQYCPYAFLGLVKYVSTKSPRAVSCPWTRQR
jgi:hypothetical protein